jgi:hypothetical protein
MVKTAAVDTIAVTTVTAMASPQPFPPIAALASHWNQPLVHGNGPRWYERIIDGFASETQNDTSMHGEGALWLDVVSFGSWSPSLWCGAQRRSADHLCTRPPGVQLRAAW